MQAKTVATRFMTALSLLFASACAGPLQLDLDERGASTTHDGYLFRASNAIEDGWLHVKLRGATDYDPAVFDGTVAIHAKGRESASGLARRISLDTTICPEISWAWQAASIFLVFRHPGMLSAPNPVPALGYVWTTDHARPETIVDSPYLKGTVKSLAKRSGVAENQGWVVERRNLIDDFVAAHGRLPDDRIQAIILFSDNDQTKEPVEAYYGWARVHCTVDGVSVEEDTGW